MTRQDELRNLVKLAVSGPWDADGPAWNRTVWSSPNNRVCFMAHSDGLNDDRDIANSRLVAQAPTLATDLATALDDLEKARAEVARLRGALDNSFLAIVEARSHADPGSLFRVLNELLGKVDDIRRAALTPAQEG